MGKIVAKAYTNLGVSQSTSVQCLEWDEAG